MNAISPLKDDAARRDAISCLDRSILVEAGAGSGKTAVMAGRIAIMLAEGIAPRSIAAVTFTELAASELLSRVREFVGELAEGRIPTELKIALPNGLSDAQRVHLHSASATIDEITCTTIHGFCQRLIKPYPAEADIDPGAGIIDRNQGELVFHDLVDSYLRERLDGVAGQPCKPAGAVLAGHGDTSQPAEIERSRGVQRRPCFLIRFVKAGGREEALVGAQLERWCFLQQELRQRRGPDRNRFGSRCFVGSGV